MSQYGNLRTLGAVMLALVMLTSGVSGRGILDKRAKAQRDVTASIEQWKQSYKGLAGTQTKWDASYRQASSIKDLVGLLASIGLEKDGLASNSDMLVLTKVDQVVLKGVQVGMTRVCLGSGGDAFVVSATSYVALLQGINKLASRPDIDIGTVTIQGDSPVPRAKLGEFCVLLRGAS